MAGVDSSAIISARTSLYFGSRGFSGSEAGSWNDGLGVSAFDGFWGCLADFEPMQPMLQHGLRCYRAAMTHAYGPAVGRTGDLAPCG